MAKLHFLSRCSLVLLSFALPVLACSAGGGGAKSTEGSGGHGQGASSNGGDGIGGVNLTTGAGGTDGGQPATCDDAGNCTCINIASIGHEGVWGPCSSDSTTALQNWLNTQSTAQVDNYNTTKPTLTKDFLSKYHVIILQWMVTSGKQYDDGEPWQFTADEVNALKEWVNNGGGLIALSGYQCDGNGCPIKDITATNQLLSFTDIQFNSDGVLDPSKSGCSNCYCWGGPLPLGAALAGSPGTPTVGTWDQSSPVGKNLHNVGVYIMRSIQSTTATVDCTDGTHDYAVHEQVGKGHVMAFGDEWVTYSGQWLGTAACLNPGMYTNPSDPCYQKSAAQVFQIPQFWYNAIKYASSSVECFTIDNPDVIK